MGCALVLPTNQLSSAAAENPTGSFAVQDLVVAARGTEATLHLLDPRYWHTAVWTGSEMIVFGGMSSVGTIYGDGRRCDPATDTWTLLPATGSPGERQAQPAPAASGRHVGIR